MNCLKLNLPVSVRPFRNFFAFYRVGETGVTLFPTVIGSVGRYLAASGTPFPRATVQGGFVPYNAHDRDVVRLERFEGRDRAGTFNLNGDVKAALAFIACGTPARFVGKNVCHTVVYDKAVHEAMRTVTPKQRAGELLREFMGVYLERHEEGKKFHDPTAAVCHLHPEVGRALPVDADAQLGLAEHQRGIDVDGAGHFLLDALEGLAVRRLANGPAAGHEPGEPAAEDQQAQQEKEVDAHVTKKRIPSPARTFCQVQRPHFLAASMTEGAEKAGIRGDHGITR